MRQKPDSSTLRVLAAVIDTIIPGDDFSALTHRRATGRRPPTWQSMAVYRPLAGPGQGNPREVLEEDGTTWTADGTTGGDKWGLNSMVLGGGNPALARHGLTLPARRLHHGFITRRTGRLQPRGLACDLPIPFAIKSIPRNGLAVCAACWQCMGHACPVGAKNGSHTAFIPQALQTGRCHSLLEAQAVGIEHTDGVARGMVRVSAGQRTTVGSDTVVVAAGAIETPRLLLASRLGNDNVRRHLQGHAVTLLVGRTRETVPTFRGSGHSIATMDFVHDGGPAGGGVLFDAFAPYPPSRGEKNACRNAGPRPQSTRPEQSAWDDPASSAADADGLVWRSKNVYVMAHSSRPRVALMSGAWNRRPLIP